MIIVGCSADPPLKQKKFCDKQNLPYTMLCDEDHSMLEAYGVWGPKKFMGREYLGISRVTYIISEKGFIRLNNELRKRRFIVEEVPYAEIAKMEGLLRCSTMPLIRE